MKPEIKLKPCKVCKTEFQQYKSTQKVCSIDCAIKEAKKIEKKKFKRETLKLKKDLKASDRGYQLRLAQTEFNKFIRLRDKDKPCISCQRHHDGQYHAGHYKTIGAFPELRFNEDNCHKQCAPCNNNLSGNILLYRQGLLSIIGESRLNALEGDHKAQNYTIDEIKEIRELYKNKCRELNEI